MATLRQLIESLQSTDVSGAIPKEIRATLVEQNRRNNAVYNLVGRFKTDRTIHFWVQRTKLPQGGPSLQAPPLSGVGSVTPSPSTYVNNNGVNIRSLTYKGDVGKVAQQVATAVGDIIELEMKGQFESEARDETVLNFYGSEHATAATNKIQWSGMDLQVATANKIKVAGAAALSTLDGLYDLVRTAVGSPNLGKDWAFFMSMKMQTAVNGLFSNVNRVNLPVSEISGIVDPRIFGEQDAEFFAQRIKTMAGVEVLTYRGVPIVPTDFITPAGTMGAVTIGAGATTGTTFTGSQAYYYQVEAVTQLGKSVACSEVSRTPSAGASVLLSWSTPTITDADGNAYPIYNYRIFRGTTTGAETLYAVVAAYDGNDNPVTSWTDDNAAHDPLPAIGGTGTPSGLAWVPLAGASDGVTVPASAATTEDIFLWPLNPDIAGLAVLNEVRQEVLAMVSSRSVQFETTSDKALTVYSPRFGAQATGVTN